MIRQVGKMIRKQPELRSRKSQAGRRRGRFCLLPSVFCLLSPVFSQAQPSNYVGIGAGFNGGTTPNLNVTASFATLITRSAGLYSFTSADYYSGRTRPFSVTSSLRTGVAMVVRQWSHFMLMEMFNAGAAAGAGGVMPSVGVGAIGIVKLNGGFALAVNVHEAKQVGAANWALQSVLQVGHVW